MSYRIRSRDGRTLERRKTSWWERCLPKSALPLNHDGGTDDHYGSAEVPYIAHTVVVVILSASRLAAKSASNPIGILAIACEIIMELLNTPMRRLANGTELKISEI